MRKTKTFTLYKIYYGEELIYLGRTAQLLQDRIRNHLFKKPGLKKIDINKISKIEYAEFETRADMYLYEIYYINLYKPMLNKDDKARDELTVRLPDISFTEWTTPLWEKWKEEINDTERKYQELKIKIDAFEEQRRRRKSQLHKLYKDGAINSEQYWEESNKIRQERAVFQYDNGIISFGQYKEEMGFHELGE